MELFPWWFPVALLSGLLLLLVVLQLVFPSLNIRNRRRPTHPSESPEGEARHADRMQGLRAMADDIKAQEAATESPTEAVSEEVVEQVHEEDGRW